MIPTVYSGRLVKCFHHPRSRVINADWICKLCHRIVFNREFGNYCVSKLQDSIIFIIHVMELDSNCSIPTIVSKETTTTNTSSNHQFKNYNHYHWKRVQWKDVLSCSIINMDEYSYNSNTNWYISTNYETIHPMVFSNVQNVQNGYKKKNVMINNNNSHNNTLFDTSFILHGSILH